MNEIEWTSQIGQDKFVFETLKSLDSGYFLEIGAFDGIKSSNTYRLEEFGWTGICVEANPETFKKLQKNRKCECVNVAVSNFIGELHFNFENSVWDKSTNEIGKDKVNCVTLTQLFEDYKVPSIIDYMSLDIEGCEFQALQEFPFDTHICKIITVEHNLYIDGPENKMKIKEILEKNDYICIRENVAYTKNGLNNPFEDWYIHKSLEII